MRFIPTRIHGALDYLMALVFLLMAWSMNGSAPGAHIPFLILGLAVILYSLFTDYELGFVRRIPMPVHLLLDLIGGVLLALSPWLLGFADNVYLPHVILGVLEIGAALMTRKHPDYPPDMAGLTTRAPADRL